MFLNNKFRGENLENSTFQEKKYKGEKKILDRIPSSPVKKKKKNHHLLTVYSVYYAPTFYYLLFVNKYIF